MDSNQSAYLDFVKIQAAVTTSSAMEGDSMVKIKLIDHGSLLAAMRNIILSLGESLNVGKKTTPNQAVEIAGLVIEKYYYLKLEEFILVCKKIKMGELIQLYDRLDAPTIMKAIEVFLNSEERTLIFEKEAARYKEREMNSEVDIRKAYEEYKNRKELDPKEERKQKDHDYHTWKQNWLNERSKNDNDHEKHPKD